MSSQQQNSLDEQASAEEKEDAQDQVAFSGAAEGADPQDERIMDLERQLDEVMQRERDVLLRVRAEADNIRRRAEQDVEKAHKFALEKFSTALLPVVDNLERALELAGKSDHQWESMVEGIELTLKSLLDVMNKFGVESINQVNVPFNPEVHQAMTIMESDQHEPNYVIMVLQKGYILNGRLIRPAMVAVSKSNA